MNWVEDMINDYYKWLRQRTTTRLDETTGWSAISTPFLGAFNDPIEMSYIVSQLKIIFLR